MGSGGIPCGLAADNRQGARPPGRRPTTDEGAGGVPHFPSSSTASRNSVSGQGGASNPIDSAEAPKAVSVNDLLALQGLPEKTDQASRALASGISPGPAASDIQAGDVLLLTGWVHRVFRAPDNTYRLHVSPNRNLEPELWSPRYSPRPGPGLASCAGAAPDGADLHQAATASAARTFVARLGHAASNLCATDRPAVESNRAPCCAFTGKQSQDTTARWEIRPVLEVQFATPSEPFKPLTIAVRSLLLSLCLPPSRGRYNTERTRPPSTRMVVPVI